METHGPTPQFNLSSLSILKYTKRMYVLMPTFVDTVCYARHHGNLCRHISSASCHSSNAAAASAVDWPHVVRRQVKVDETMCSCPRFRSPCLHTRIPPEEVAAVDSIISIVYQCISCGHQNHPVPRG